MNKKEWVKQFEEANGRKPTASELAEAQSCLLYTSCIPFATLIYTSLKIATASIAFWTKQSGAMIYIFYMFNDFAKYPICLLYTSHVDLVFLFGKGCFQGLIFVQYAYEKIQTVELDRLWLSPDSVYSTSSLK